MNFVEAIEKETNMVRTENGAQAFKSTNSSLVDLFGTIGSLRTRNDFDIIKSFYNGFSEDKLLAMKMLFYARNIRGGLGERRTFKVILKELGSNYPEIIKKNLELIPQFGRWDDLFELIGTPVEKDVFALIKHQLDLDLNSDTPSIMAKWLKSENTSSEESRKIAKLTRKMLGLSPKEYRKILTKLRAKIDVVEVKMSDNRFNEIIYPNVTSKAMANYRTAFYKHDEERFELYVDSLKKGESKINSGTLYPYEIFEKMGLRGCNRLSHDAVLQAQWDALPNYIAGENNVLVMADTSGSMTSNNGRPMATSISLAVYFAERNKGIFKDVFMTFSSSPSFVRLKGEKLYQKVQNIPSIVQNTNLQRAFELILTTAIQNNLPQEEMPKALVVISDMEFDQGTYECSRYNTLFDSLVDKYNQNGYDMPNVVFWNVNARNSYYQTHSQYNGVQLASGSSPSVFKSLVDNIGKTPYQAMLDVLNAEEYSKIKI